MLFKWPPLENASAFRLGFKVKETVIWPSPGTILTISLEDMFGPSTVYMIVQKGEEESFNPLSINLSLLSISSPLSV